MTADETSTMVSGRQQVALHCQHGRGCRDLARPGPRPSPLRQDPGAVLRSPGPRVAAAALRFVPATGEGVPSMIPSGRMNPVVITTATPPTRNRRPCRKPFLCDGWLGLGPGGCRQCR